VAVVGLKLMTWNISIRQYKKTFANAINNMRVFLNETRKIKGYAQPFTIFRNDGLGVFYKHKELNIIPVTPNTHGYDNRFARGLKNFENIRDLPPPFIMHFAGKSPERQDGVYYIEPDTKRFFSLPVSLRFTPLESEDDIFKRKYNTAYGEELFNDKVRDLQQLFDNIIEIRYIRFELYVNPENPENQTWYINRKYKNNYGGLLVPLTDEALIEELYISLEAVIVDYSDFLEQIFADTNTFNCKSFAGKLLSK